MSGVEATSPVWIHAPGVNGNDKGERGVYPRIPMLVGGEAERSEWGLRIGSNEPQVVAIYAFDRKDPEEASWPSRATNAPT